MMMTCVPSYNSLGQTQSPVNSCVSERELSDWCCHYPYLAMAHGDGSASKSAAVASGPRKAVRKSFFAQCCNGGLQGLAGRFGLSAQQFGMNYFNTLVANEVVDDELTPLEAAQRYVLAITDFFACVDESIIRGLSE